MTSKLESKRIAATVAYDGAAFKGWQVQPGERTVQGEIEKALAVLCPSECPRIQGSGRTDAGVHARGQVFHVNVVRDFSDHRWQQALNGLLPDDIRVLKVRTVPADFHSRFDALSKQYRYFVYAEKAVPPDLRFTRTHIRKPLDMEAMKLGASLLQGEHDFLSFSANRGTVEESTVRTLYKMELIQTGPEICMVAEANGFMYKMVRQLAGALLRVGLGEMTPKDLQAMLDVPERNHLAPTAPAQALFLWYVTYPHWTSHEHI
ncbi:tRNA pseudouridine(38-40) synthase TruA [Kiritimatiellota bacterium B12222]|nr:tRNA pseudouridine(38-40) synthase TruA [Kiritimatiellota bacterium B12222]